MKTSNDEWQQLNDKEEQTCWDFYTEHAVKIWNVRSGEPVSAVKARTWVHCMSFSDNEKFVALGGMGRVSVAAVASGAEVFEAKLDGGRVDAVALSGDGALVACDLSENVVIGCTKTGDLLASISYENGPFHAFSDMAFSADGKFLAVADFSGVARVFQLSPLREQCVVFHAGGVRALSFSRDGKVLITGGNDQMARATDVISGKEISSIRHCSCVINVSVSSDGKTVASIGHSSETCLWATNTGLVLNTLRHNEKHQHGVNVADGDLIIVGRELTPAGERYFLSQLGAKTGKVILDRAIEHRCDPNGERIVISPSGNFVATGGLLN